jgi:phage gp29-like protein
MAETTTAPAPALPRASKSAKARSKPVIGSIVSQVARLNRWRDQYNPLRGITVARAVALIESYRRGEMADLHWAYSFAEEADDDLFALVERRTSAIEELDWNIKVTPEKKRRDNFDEKLADDQAAMLRAAYDRIDNLTDAIGHLAMASFRGYAHLEKQSLKPESTGQVDHLEIVDQWNLVRDGYRGPWKYNPDARQTTYQGLAGDPLPMDRFIYREVNRHINRLGLMKLLRSGLGVKDWTAFIEIYGIPSGIVIMPGSIPPGKESEYEDAARRIAEGGNGALPAGSDYKPNDQPRGVNPFSSYLDFLTQKLVLVGTGGLLTMLTQSGSGTLAGSAHTETFQTIAKAEARKINASFQRGLDDEVLDEKFPGKPHLAYFELAAQEETDTGQIVDEVLKLSQAGYQADPDEVSEKTSYTLTLKPPTPAAPASGPAGLGALRNRALNPQPSTLNQLLRARAEALQPLFNRLAALEKAGDPAALRQAIEELRRDLPDLADQVHDRPELAQALFDAMSEAMAGAAVAELRQKGTIL